MIKYFKDFFKQESAVGILLIAAAVLALVAANSPLATYYDALLGTPVEITFGQFEIHKPLLLWINDGLMALFFFVVGLELKRELIDGHLSSPGQIALPAIAAVGGIVAPAGVYAFINWGEAEAMKGWAIPTATDIAFALGILTLLGKRVPVALKVFLVSLAIFDDIGAIVIIALFYTAELSDTAMAVASACLVILFAMNRKHVSEQGPYIIIGMILWASVLKSGVHATLAGVALAMFIPYRHKDKPEISPCRQLEHSLHPAVSFQILPLFAFANAGVNLSGIGLDALTHAVPLGITLGLFLGKPIGVMLFSWVAIKLGLAKLPEGSNWTMLLGVACITGIGFTMSLFIGSLAFENSIAEYITENRIGILLGTVLSAVTGYLIVALGLKRLPK